MEVRTLSRAGRAIRVGLRPAEGAGAAWPPLVVFNGLGASLELLEPFVAALAHRPLVVVDAPGIGTPAPSMPYRFASLARQANDVLTELGFAEGPVDVMGVSWGGCLAQQFAFQYPGRCRRLVLAATSPGSLMVPGRPAAVLGTLGAALHPGAAAPARMASRVLGRDFEAHPQRLIGQLRRLVPSDLRSQACQLLALWGWSSLPWLWRLRQPTLVLAAHDDHLVPLANARLLAALIPKASLHILEGGHGFLLTRAAQAAGLVQDFLAGEVAATGSAP
jgi:poly(3-hydroxyalkanoate) depolymerase